VAVAELLAVLTSQPTTGRHVSWFLTFCSAPEREQSEALGGRAFAFPDWLWAQLPRLPRTHARRMEGGLIRLEQNLLLYCRHRDGASLRDWACVRLD
jgi:hypothetical protein